MQYPNLSELRDLRAQEKAIKARIEQISDDATKEALSILARDNKDHGELTADGHKFQVQMTPVIDMSDFRRYKGEDAIRWRTKKEAQDQSKKYSAALTKEMKAITDGFIAMHPDWTPDDTKVTIKCID